jgi:hypothetical protein
MQFRSCLYYSIKHYSNYINEVAVLIVSYWRQCKPFHGQFALLALLYFQDDSNDGKVSVFRIFLSRRQKRLLCFIFIPPTATVEFSFQPLQFQYTEKQRQSIIFQSGFTALRHNSSGGKRAYVHFQFKYFTCTIRKIISPVHIISWIH